MRRGLVGTDASKANEHLEHLGYDRLNLYWQPFQQRVPDPNNPKKPLRFDQFDGDAEFRHAVDLYLFDKQLRLLFLDALKRIEVALRVDLAHAPGKRNVWTHRDPAHLTRSAPIIPCRAVSGMRAG